VGFVGVLLVGGGGWGGGWGGVVNGFGCGCWWMGG